MFGGAGYFLGGLVAGGPLGQVAPRTLLVAGNVALALIIGLAYSRALGTIGSAAMLPLAGFAGSLGWVALTVETPAGAATTMTLNASLFNLGAAGGGAIGGLLLALAGYEALAVGVPLFGLASPVLARQRSRPSARSLTPSLAPVEPGEGSVSASRVATLELLSTSAHPLPARERAGVRVYASDSMR